MLEMHWEQILRITNESTIVHFAGNSHQELQYTKEELWKKMVEYHQWHNSVCCLIYVLRNTLLSHRSLVIPYAMME